MEKFRISVCARGGLCVEQLSSTNFLNSASVPCMFFIKIGNDLLNLTFHYPTLVRGIISLALYLREGLGISVVIIDQLLC